MVANKQPTLLEQAITETYVLCAMYKHEINPKQIGVFLSKLLTGDKASAKLLWKSVVRDRLYSCGMETILIQELEDFVYDI